jgi:hypothetical protein
MVIVDRDLHLFLGTNYLLGIVELRQIRMLEDLLDGNALVRVEY